MCVRSPHCCTRFLEGGGETLWCVGNNLSCGVSGGRYLKSTSFQSGEGKTGSEKILHS